MKKHWWILTMLLLAMAAACAPGSALTPDDIEKNEPETDQAPDFSAETVLPEQLTGGEMTPESEPETQETKRPEMPTLRAQPAPGKGSPTSTTRGNVFPDGYDVVGWDAKTGEKALNVTGMLPTPCHQIRFDVSEPDDVNRIEINLYSTSDPEMICAQVLSPFMVDIPLGVLSPGDYTIWVNGRLAGELHQTK